MALLSISKIRRYMNRAPAWQQFLVTGIYFCVANLIIKGLSYRLRNGGWDMDWATKFGESLVSGVLFGLFWIWLNRKSVSKNDQGEQQRS
jgi:cell shape-determining protein MreD